MQSDPSPPAARTAPAPASAPDRAPHREPPTIRHRFLSVNGLRMHIAESGPDAADAPDAPLVVCLHGFPECWYSWRHQLRFLGARGVRVVAPDLRGYGDTDKPSSGYDIDTLAADVAALVRALGAERATIVGHDWGAAIAWHTAYRHPALVERLAVMNCPPADVLFGGVLQSPRQLLSSWYIFFFQLPILPERRLTKDGGAIVPRIFKAGAGRRGVFAPEDLEAFREALVKPGAASGALAYYRRAFQSVAQARRAEAALPGGLPMPGLILWGASDPFLHVRLTHGLAQRFAAPCTVRFLPGVGHWTQQEAPDAANAALADLLGLGAHASANASPSPSPSARASARPA